MIIINYIFLGIIKFSPYGSGVFVKQYEELIKIHAGTFQQAPSILKAYLTDMIQELINSGMDVAPVFVNGKYFEIDTPEDVKNVEKSIKKF